MPIISGLTYTVTDSTIVATWTTDVSSDSNLSAGGKAAIDNGLATSSTSHQSIVTGLLSNTLYSCFVTSGGSSSTPQNVTTKPAVARIPLIIGGSLERATQMPSTGPVHGDVHYNFVSSDNKTYIVEDDGNGFVSGTPNAGANMQLAVLTNETTFVGTAVNLFTAYGALNTITGTDGPGATALTNKITGLFGMLGNLYIFATRQDTSGGGAGCWYNNVIKSSDKGATWNNYQTLSTFNAAGSPINTATFPLAQKTYGWVTPILYGADDGTLGYNSTGNQIDGANGFVYCTFVVSAFSAGAAQSSPAYLLRVPRIQFDSGQLSTGVQYWIGPARPTPTDFVNDANWSNSDAAKTIIFQPAVAVAWPIVTFLPGINRYVLACEIAGVPDNTTYFYEAPTPAGPWTQIFTDNGNAEQYYGFMPVHRDWFSNAATNNIPVRVIYSGGGPNSSFTTYYYPTVSVLTLVTSGMIQIVSYGFTTIENPLSDGGNFSISSSYAALQVPSAGVCEATATSTNCIMHWSGAVPIGDTGGTWPNDQYSEQTVGALDLPGTDNNYLTVRQAAGAHTLYILVLAGTTAAPASTPQTLGAFVAGVFHSLTTFNITISAGDVIRLSITGNVLTTSQNGTVMNTFTDTNNFVPGPGAPGLGIISTVLSASTITAWAAGANQATAPTFAPPGGSYPSAQTVTLTGPGGSTIYYTLDGSTPTRSSSSVASGGTVSVTPPKTLKAISSVTNFVDSTIANAIYSSTGAGSSDLGPGYDFKYRL